MVEFESPWAFFLYCWSVGALGSCILHWFFKPILSIGVYVRYFTGK